MLQYNTVFSLESRQGYKVESRVWTLDIADAVTRLKILCSNRDLNPDSLWLNTAADI